MLGSLLEVRRVASPFVEQTLSEAPPDLELLSAVEDDMARVDQTLRDLDDEERDPEEVVAWLPTPPVADAAEVTESAPTDAVPAETVPAETVPAETVPAAELEAEG